MKAMPEVRIDRSKTQAEESGDVVVPETQDAFDVPDMPMSAFLPEDTSTA
jgi:hypothetical protein